MSFLKRVRTTSDSESTELPLHVSVEESNIRHFTQDNLDGLNAFVLCSLWCLISIVNNIISKSLLNNFPYPLCSTLSQLLATAVCAQPIIMLWRVPCISWAKLDARYILCVILPLGLGKLISAGGTHISNLKLPLSYSHTVKVSMPIFVVILSTIFLKQRFPTKVYLSLIIIFCGVAMASITELMFDALGLLSALCATASFAALNILTKKCLNDTHMHQFRLLQLVAAIATAIFIPIWIYNDLIYIVTAKGPVSQYSSSLTLIMLVLDGVLNFLQNLIAFTLIAKVTPLSYAICNVIKRISVISMSLVFFGNPVTVLNLTGTGLSIFGVLYYNKVKIDIEKTKKSLGISSSYSHLPTNDLPQNSSLYSHLQQSLSFKAANQNEFKTAVNRVPHIVIDIPLQNSTSRKNHKDFS